MRAVMLVLVLSMMLSTGLAMNKRAQFVVTNHEVRRQYLEKNDDQFKDLPVPEGTTTDGHHYIPREKFTPSTGTSDGSGTAGGD
ncbi:hypothetical protein ACJRO7_003834 [Eucalyptus globulus]|uniref:Uncharacterized protein n=1 Tax=Eucalyptus globulus TaxID=34317 RepID=A0ABD3IXL7_EUCGL